MAAVIAGAKNLVKGTFKVLHGVFSVLEGTGGIVEASGNVGGEGVGALEKLVGGKSPFRQCTGVTKKGKRCKNKALPGKKRCRMHSR